MSTKLFYKNPYLREFSGTIIEKEKSGEGWKIQLDQTAFYPEGGGQPADKGFFNGLAVTDVQKDGGKVYHFVDELPVEDIISGQIQWDHRFDYMQQHTGQHILSAVLKRLLGAATVAVHQAEDYTSIEIDFNDMSEDDIRRVEDAANVMVCSNLPVYSYLNGHIPIDHFPIRRETKYTENVRLVQIGGISLEGGPIDILTKASELLEQELDVTTPGLKDLAACGGVHTVRTGEVGLIKFTGKEKVRGRIRLFWLIGKRAYDDYRKKTEITETLGEALSVPLGGIEEEFHRLQSSLGDEKKKSSDLLKGMALLKAEELKKEYAEGRKSFVFENLDSDYFKKIIICLTTFTDIHLCLFNVKGNEGQWALVSTGDEGFDFNKFRNELLPLVKGKGGGKAPLWQGKLGDCSSLNTFRDKFSLPLT